MSKVARVQINRELPTMLEQQLQMYRDMNVQLRSNPKIDVVSILQEEPLCTTWRRGSKYTYCACCPVEQVIGRNCGGRAFFNLTNFVTNEELVRVTDHAITVLECIVDGDRVPDEVYVTHRKIDNNKNPYMEYK